jgi:hypothetical protein
MHVRVQHSQPAQDPHKEAQQPAASGDAIAMLPYSLIAICNLQALPAVRVRCRSCGQLHPTCHQQGRSAAEHGASAPGLLAGLVTGGTFAGSQMHSTNNYVARPSCTKHGTRAGLLQLSASKSPCHLLGVFV